jgi:hypothetical protein
MNENPTRPVVGLRIEEVIALVTHALANDDVARADRWLSLALSANDACARTDGEKLA